MSKRHIRIGEYVIQIECNSPSLITFFARNFQSANGKHGPLDMKIAIEGNYGVPFSNYDVIITKEPNKIVFRRADYLIEADSDYKTAKISVYDELALKHALMNLYSSFIVHHNWGLLIHSSCVIENGKAHMFAGQSGAGKSTAARLSHPRELLSDEATLVKITPEGLTVFDSPFRSELEARGKGESCPLASIQLLHQALQNDRVRVKKSDALLQLMDKVFYWTNSPEETRRILALLKLVVNKVPVYKLHFQKNNMFWELIS